jgi:hypothetical protein
VVDELAEVADAAGETVELGDEEAVGVAGVERREGALEAGTLQRLCGEAGVLAGGDELEVHGEGVSVELRALRVEADAFAGLLLGADADVPDDTGGKRHDELLDGTRCYRDGRLCNGGAAGAIFFFSNE